MRIRLLSSLTVAAAIAVSLSAHAAPPPMYDIFELTDPAGSIDWILPDISTPTTSDVDDAEWTIPEIDAGDPLLSGIGEFTFDDSGSLQVELSDNILQDFLENGDGKMFSGSNSDPDFTPGTYHLLDSLGHAATLTITPTPEPSSIMLLGTAIFGMAAAMRRRLTV